FLPLLLIVVFGYAANFNVSHVSVAVVGPGARAAAAQLRAPFFAASVRPQAGRPAAVSALRDGDASAAIVTGAGRPKLLLDGSSMFTAQAALRSIAGAV